VNILQMPRKTLLAAVAVMALPAAAIDEPGAVHALDVRTVHQTVVLLLPAGDGVGVG
jgi:hypothetical protein